MSIPAIQTHLLTRLFDHQRAVDRLTLTVASGAIVGIVGPVGAGKTTLLHLLGGWLLPSSGSAHVFGYDVWTQAEAIRSCTLLIGELDAADSPIHCDEILASVYSSVHRRSLVLLDEPLRNANPAQVLDLCRQLQAIVRSAGATLVLTSIHMDVLESVCDSFGVLHQGMLLAIAPVAEIHTRCVIRVEIRGRGFTHDIVALLRRRAAVSVVTANNSYLRLYLQSDLDHHTDSLPDSAPLVTLLIESGAEVEEVNRQLVTVSDLSASVATNDWPARQK